MADGQRVELGGAASARVRGDDEAAALPEAAIELAVRLEAGDDALGGLEVLAPPAGEDDLLALGRDGARGRDAPEVLPALGHGDALLAEALHQFAVLVELGERDVVEPVGRESAAGGDDLAPLGERHGVGRAVRAGQRCRETALAERAVEPAVLREALDEHPRAGDARGVGRASRHDHLAVLLDRHPVPDRVLARDLGPERDATVVERAVGPARLGQAGDAEGQSAMLGDVARDDGLPVLLRGHRADFEALRERGDAVLAEGVVEPGRLALGDQR